MNFRFFVLFVLGLVCFISCSDDNSTNSTDNNSEIVTIGSQVWTTKNLDVDHYRNGDIIPQVTDSHKWINLKTGAWTYYNNDSTLGKIYGKIYNYYAVMDPRGLAPTGYHVPNLNDWDILIKYLGGDSLAGGKLKEAGTSHWKSPNYGATNSSKFFALPGGVWAAIVDGSFKNIGYEGYWWVSGSDIVNCKLENVSSFIHESWFDEQNGYSVRCVKDK